MGKEWNIKDAESEQARGQKLKGIKHNIVIWLGILALILFIVLINADDKDDYEYKEGKFIFVEAKCFTGSIYHKDALALSDDNIEIYRWSR